MGTYGRGFTLSNPANGNVGDTNKGPSQAGPYTREGGFLAYYEVRNDKLPKYILKQYTMYNNIN